MPEALGLRRPQRLVDPGDRIELLVREAGEIHPRRAHAAKEGEGVRRER
jgi:hypothetical protein